MTFETKLKQIIEQLRILFAKDEYKQEVEQYLAKKQSQTIVKAA